MKYISGVNNRNESNLNYQVGNTKRGVTNLSVIFLKKKLCPPFNSFCRVIVNTIKAGFFRRKLAKKFAITTVAKIVVYANDSFGVRKVIEKFRVFCVSEEFMQGLSQMVRFYRMS